VVNAKIEAQPLCDYPISDRSNCTRKGWKVLGSCYYCLPHYDRMVALKAVETLRVIARRCSDLSDDDLMGLAGELTGEAIKFLWEELNDDF
jgi:hypothetical protein